jgi:TPR repeat protein
VPIYDYAEANEEVAKLETEHYYSCCGKSICGGCVYSCIKSGNIGTCPFCKSEMDKTDGGRVGEFMKRVEANDAGSIHQIGLYYYHGDLGLLQDREKGVELWKQAAELGSSKAHFTLGNEYREGGDSKKSKFHFEAAAMAGHEDARYNLGAMELQSGNVERAVKHWTIAASAGEYNAMHNLLGAGVFSRATIDSTLIAYNNSCAEMRSDARDDAFRVFIASIGAR